MATQKKELKISSETFFRPVQQFGALPVLAIVMFKKVDGGVEHYEDGRLRATVAEKDWQEYCKQVPEAKRATL